MALPGLPGGDRALRSLSTWTRPGLALSGLPERDRAWHFPELLGGARACTTPWTPTSFVAAFLLDIYNLLNYLYKLLPLLLYDQKDDDIFRLFWQTLGRVPQGRTTRVATRGLEVSPEAVS